MMDDLEVPDTIKARYLLMLAKYLGIPNPTTANVNAVVEERRPQEVRRFELNVSVTPEYIAEVLAEWDREERREREYKKARNSQDVVIPPMTIETRALTS